MSHRYRLTPLVQKRMQYVFEENQRVLAMTHALQQGNATRAGQLLYEAHAGMQSLYEITCPEVDALVALAKNSQQVLGARMMGGGFGGCVLHIIKQESTAQYTEQACQAYYQQYKITPAVYEVTLGSGVSLVEPQAAHG